jgi:hypothetical protein
MSGSGEPTNDSQKQSEPSGLRRWIVSLLGADSVLHRSVGVSVESIIEFLVFGMLAAVFTGVITILHLGTDFTLPAYPASVVFVWSGTVIEIWKQKTGFLTLNNTVERDS